MVSRRKFIKILGIAFPFLGTFFASLAHAGKYALRLDRLEKLARPGGFETIRFDDREVLFIRDSETSIRAFHPHCTHMNCLVLYNEKTRLIECPCHGSKFDLEGNVVHGPAKKPLPRFEAELSEGRIIFSME